jgi:hypothetical protein
MIKYEFMKIDISYRNITHYRKLGYNPVLNNKLEIKTEDLSTSSHVRIIAICEICKREKEIQYHKYIVNKKRHGFYGCKSCSRQKAALTSMELYGVDNYSKTDEYRKRVEKTNIEKFGYKTNLVNPEYMKSIKETLKEKYGTEKFFEIKKSNIKRKFKSKDLSDIINQSIEYSESRYSDFSITDEYILYRNECRRITNKSLKELINNWKGLDYYDGENIVENWNLPHKHKNYPTIDHKISIYYGFVNKISPVEIGSIDNLCITKRSINSSKRDKINYIHVKSDLDIQISD